MAPAWRYFRAMSWTLGELIDGGYRIWVHCDSAGAGGMRCNHRAMVDLDDLARRLGRDHGAMAADLAGMFRCARCGARRSTITVHPPTVRDVKTGELR